MYPPVPQIVKPHRREACLLERFFKPDSQYIGIDESPMPVAEYKLVVLPSISDCPSQVLLLSAVVLQQLEKKRGKRDFASA
jgi:hypothetical protein